jgi:hypothetical protein
VKRGLRELPQGRHDAYLDWALATEFRFFQTDGRIGILIEWRSLEAAERGLEIARRFDLEVPSVYGGRVKARPRLVWAMSGPVEPIVEFVSTAGDLIGQLELALPIAVEDTLPSELRRLRIRKHVVSVFRQRHPRAVALEPGQARCRLSA